MNAHAGGGQGQVERFERLCREQGLPVTVQRRTVLEVVIGRDDHPTADRVYDEVASRIPGVSRTTVYRVLDLLVRFGIITKVSHPGAVARFDGNADHHHHLVCLHCDRVIDLKDKRLDTIKLPDTRNLGFEITEHSVQLYSVCADCRDSATVPGSGTVSTAPSLNSRKRKTMVPASKERKKKP